MGRGWGVLVIYLYCYTFAILFLYKLLSLPWLSDVAKIKLDTNILERLWIRCVNSAVVQNFLSSKVANLLYVNNVDIIEIVIYLRYQISLDITHTLVSYIRPACASHCVTNLSSKISMAIKKRGKTNTNETPLIFQMHKFPGL